MRKYNDFAPIGLKSGFENVIHQFDIEISLICGFAPQMGDKSLVVLCQDLVQVKMRNFSPF